MLNSLIGKLASVKYCDLLDRILCAIPEHVYAVDRGGTILYTNLALANAWGIGRSEMIGSTFRDIAQPESAVERFEKLLETVCQTGRQVTDVIAVPYRSLGTRDIESVLTPAFEPAGLNVAFVVGVATDVTFRSATPSAAAHREPHHPVAGSTGLPPRLEQVLALVARGYSNLEVADELQISVRTVETHRREIGKRVGFTTRSQIFRYAQEHGLLDLQLAQVIHGG